MGAGKKARQGCPYWTQHLLHTSGAVQCIVRQALVPQLVVLLGVSKQNFTSRHPAFYLQRPKGRWWRCCEVLCPNVVQIIFLSSKKSRENREPERGPNREPNPPGPSFPRPLPQRPPPGSWRKPCGTLPSPRRWTADTAAPSRSRRSSTGSATREASPTTSPSTGDPFKASF